MVTTGCPVRGCLLRTMVHSGRRATGVGAVAFTSSTPVTGDAMSASTAAWTTGYGYGGSGYVGGHWGSGGFYYNRSVNQFGGVHVTNVYNQTVVNNTYVSRTSYNGGQGGLTAERVSREPRLRVSNTSDRLLPAATDDDGQSQQALLASVNHGNPPIAATAGAGAFTGAGVVAAHGATGRFTPAAANVQRFNSDAARPQAGNGMALHSGELRTAREYGKRGAFKRQYVPPDPASIMPTTRRIHRKQTRIGRHRPGITPLRHRSITRSPIGRLAMRRTVVAHRTAAVVIRRKATTRITANKHVACRHEKGPLQSGPFLCSLFQTDLVRPRTNGRLEYPPAARESYAASP